MNTQNITCPMCGSRFDPAEHTACQSCPLQKGCHLVCCPVCGYETVDPDRSMAARLASNIFFGNKSKKGKSDPLSKVKRRMAIFSLFAQQKSAPVSSPVASDDRNVQNLAMVCPGERAKITGFSRELTPEQRTRLQAYGLCPGTWVTVSMHAPVTVLQIEHLEIALETEMAGWVQVSQR